MRIEVIEIQTLNGFIRHAIETEGVKRTPTIESARTLANLIVEAVRTCQGGELKIRRLEVSI